MWCLLLLILELSSLKFCAAFNYEYQVDLCGPNQHVDLEGLGEKASLTVTMKNLGQTNSPCSLSIRAPHTHLIHLQFFERNLELRGPTIVQGVPSCNMDVYFSGNENTPAYTRNLCSQSNLPPLDLLAPNIRLVYVPPKYHINNIIYSNMRHLILTAVGKGEVCKQQGQYVCMKIGLEPLCISGHLYCDGHQNCPKGSTANDEDEAECKNLFSRNHWKKIASTWVKIHNSVSANNKFMDNFPEEMQNVPFNDIINWIDRSNHVEVSTKAAKEIKISNTFSITQSPYWPWGYLFLPILLCGFLFVVCIFWECWITRRKSQRESIAANNASATVSIVNGYEDVQSQQPPNYNDLDLPPSYTTLFPLLNKQLDEATINRSAESIPMGSINETSSLGGESSSATT